PSQVPGCRRGRRSRATRGETRRQDEGFSPRPGAFRVGCRAMSGAQGGVLVVGSVNADLVIGVERRPGAGEAVLGSDLATFPGGKGANQGVAAARLGARVAFVGRVGTDSFGQFLREGLEREGVDTRHLQAVPGPSGVALITVGPAGDNSIIVSPGANARL